jgi:hypothetical protein
MTKKLKVAVREAWIDCGWAPLDSTLDNLVNALSRRGVVVQTAADSHISSQEVWDSWRDKVKSILARAVPYPARYGMANEIMYLLFPTPVEATLTPLTYAQACALPVGSEVVCLDVGVYSEQLTKSAIYKINSHSSPKMAFITTDRIAQFGLTSSDCHLFAAVPSATVAERGHANCLANAAGESPAPAMTDEEIGREIYKAGFLPSGAPRLTLSEKYQAEGRRARELLQPCNGVVQVSDDGKTVVPICDLKIRLEKAEAALERVRATFEGWLRPAATSEGGKHADTVLWEVAREAGLRIIPAEPAKPLRVEVAK